MTKRLNLALLILLLLIGPPFYWLLIDNHVGNRPAHPIDIALLRQMADAIPGQAPTSIAVEIVANRSVQGNILAAGSGMRSRMIGVMAFRLEVPGARPIMIDSGMTPGKARSLSMNEYSAGAQARVDAALRQAGLILLTHEHADHAGGLMDLSARQPAVLTHIRLNIAQQVALNVPRPGANAPVPLPDRPVCVAPGIVVFPSPGHTRGSQMIYVRLANRMEYLFAGDTATMDISWKQVRGRSRLLADYLSPEDRPAVAAWQRTIARLKEQDRDLLIIPGHDFEWVTDPKSFNRIRLGFVQERLVH